MSIFGNVLTPGCIGNKYKLQSTSEHALWYGTKYIALCKNKKQRNNENGLAKIEYSFCFCWILLRDCFYNIYILSFLSNIHAIWQGKNVRKNWFGVNIVFEKPSMIGAMHGSYSIFNPWMMQIILERQR